MTNATLPERAPARAATAPAMGTSEATLAGRGSSSGSSSSSSSGAAALLVVSTTLAASALASGSPAMQSAPAQLQPAGAAASKRSAPFYRSKHLVYMLFMMLIAATNSLDWFPVQRALVEKFLYRKNLPPLAPLSSAILGCVASADLYWGTTLSKDQIFAGLMGLTTAGAGYFFALDPAAKMGFKLFTEFAPNLDPILNPFGGVHMDVTIEPITHIVDRITRNEPVACIFSGPRGIGKSYSLLYGLTGLPGVIVFSFRTLGFGSTHSHPVLAEVHRALVLDSDTELVYHLKAALLNFKRSMNRTAVFVADDFHVALERDLSGALALAGMACDLYESGLASFIFVGGLNVAVLEDALNSICRGSFDTKHLLAMPWKIVGPAVVMPWSPTVEQLAIVGRLVGSQFRDLREVASAGDWPLAQAAMGKLIFQDTIKIHRLIAEVPDAKCKLLLVLRRVLENATLATTGCADFSMDQNVPVDIFFRPLINAGLARVSYECVSSDDGLSDWAFDHASAEMAAMHVLLGLGDFVNASLVSEALEAHHKAFGETCDQWGKTGKR